jgi:hypothetical protein
MTELDNKAVSCNYAGYVDKYVTYPPTGLLPLPGNSTVGDEGCDLWDEIFNAALIVNPAFNIYRIFDTVRILRSACHPMFRILDTYVLTFFILSIPFYGTSLASRRTCSFYIYLSVHLTISFLAALLLKHNCHLSTLTARMSRKPYTRQSMYTGLNARIRTSSPTATPVSLPLSLCCLTSSKKATGA